MRLRGVLEWLAREKCSGLTDLAPGEAVMAALEIASVANVRMNEVRFQRLMVGFVLQFLLSLYTFRLGGPLSGGAMAEAQKDGQR